MEEGKKKSKWFLWMLIGAIIAVVLYSIILIYWKMYFVGK